LAIDADARELSSIFRRQSEGPRGLHNVFAELSGLFLSGELGNCRRGAAGRQGIRGEIGGSRTAPEISLGKSDIRLGSCDANFPIHAENAMVG
jgi:hypothetical protein